MGWIGAQAVRFRWAVVAVWIAAAVGCVAFLPSMASVVDQNQSTFLPSDEPSVEAATLAAPFTPLEGSTAQIVIARSGAALTPADLARLADAERRVRGLDDVSSVRDQGVSADGRAATALVVSPIAVSDPDASDVVARIRSEIERVDFGPGVEAELTGTLAAQVDTENASASASRLTAILTNVVVLVMLFLVYRSLLAPVVTLLPAVVALAVGGPVIAAASQAGWFDVSSVTQALFTVIVIGAGTDYGLFLVLRTREEIAAGHEPREAVIRSVRNVGESIASSAGTVIVALLSLLLASFGLYADLGPALAIAVAIMLVAALTLLPALVAILGRRVFWPRRITAQAEDGLWGRIAERVVSRPRRALLAGGIFLVVLALCATGFTSAGFGGGGGGPSGSGSAKGDALIAAHYPEALTDPTTVVMRFDRSVWSDLGPVARAQAELSARPAFSSVSGLTDPAGTAIPAAELEELHATLGPPSRLAPVPTTDAVPAAVYEAYRATAQYVSPDGRTVQFLTGLRAGPASGTAALDAVPEIRREAGAVAERVGAAEAGVAGIAPVSYDISSVSNQDLKRVLPVVLVLIAGLLALVLRSLVAPHLSGRQRRAVVLRGARARRARLPVDRRGGRPQLRPALPHVRLPHGARLGLQHPRDEPHPRGGAGPAPPPRDHARRPPDGHDGDLGGHGAGGHLPRGRDHDPEHPGAPARHRDRARRPPRHVPGANAPGALGRRAPGPLELVAVADVAAPRRDAAARRAGPTTDRGCRHRTLRSVPGPSPRHADGRLLRSRLHARPSVVAERCADGSRRRCVGAEPIPRGPRERGRAGRPAGLALGDRVADRYELIARLGAGGMGEVFLARDIRLGRRVAVKALLAHLSSDPGLIERLRREARALAALRHPGIVGLHDLVESRDGRLVLVLEYVPGTPLDAEIAGGPLRWARCAEIGGQICAALAAAHERGVVHRDVKPANILIEPNGRVRVADFGIARLRDEATLGSHAGPAIGTPAFMSPEQARGLAATPRSDLYSLGALLFEAATGRRPFEPADGGFAAAVMHVTEPVPDPRDANPIVPAQAAATIVRALAKDPEERFGSAAEMGAALASGPTAVWVGGGPWARAPARGTTPDRDRTRPVTMPPRIARTRPAGPRRRRMLGGVVATLVVAVIALGGAIVGRATSQAPGAELVAAGVGVRRSPRRWRRCRSTAARTPTRTRAGRARRSGPMVHGSGPGPGTATAAATSARRRASAIGRDVRRRPARSESPPRRRDLGGGRSLAAAAAVRRA